MLCCLPADLILFYCPLLSCEPESRQRPHITSSQLISYFCKTKSWEKLWSCLCHIKLYGWEVQAPQPEQMIDSQESNSSGSLEPDRGPSF